MNTPTRYDMHAELDRWAAGQTRAATLAATSAAQPDAETRYVQSCYGLPADYPQSCHAFTRGAERREYTCTMGELARLIDEETREGWTYAGRVNQ